MSLFIDISICIQFQPKRVFNVIKVTLLILIWMLFTVILMLKDEKELSYQPLSVPVGKFKRKSQFRNSKCVNKELPHHSFNVSD